MARQIRQQATRQRRGATRGGSPRGLVLLAVAALLIIGGGASYAVLVAAPTAPSPTAAATTAASVGTPASPAASPTGPVTAAPTVAPSPTTVPSSPPPTPSPTPAFVAAAMNGVLLPPEETARAHAHPIAVMIDDNFRARPQSGLADADLVYHAPAEGGIPRYMALYQVGDPQSVGPIRSSRLYYVAWAGEWNAVYVHHGGSPNSISFLRRVGDGRLVYRADGLRWEGSYLFRTRTRVAPHNLYSTGERLRELAGRVGATAPFDRSAWTFTDELPLADRLAGSGVVVPYTANRVSYRYDRARNRYVRSVSGQSPQRDAATREVIAPANVIIQFVRVGRLPNRGGENTNEATGRLEIGYQGTGRAMVLRNGEIVQARWSKTSDAAPTRWLYASGPRAGQPIPLVRGQIFVQVVPSDLRVTTTPGRDPDAPAPTPRGVPGTSPGRSPGATAVPPAR